MRNENEIKRVLIAEKGHYADGGETDNIIKGWIEALEYVLGVSDEE